MKKSFGVPEQSGVLKQSNVVALGIFGGHKSVAN